MELIERYLFEIGRLIPAKKRGDILAELRSVLHDTLEGKVDGEPSEADVAAVIQEMGAPGEVAAAYHPQNQYLIGPELFPTFKLIAGIVFTVIILVQLIFMFFAVVFVDVPFSTSQFLWDVFGGLPWAIGIVVLIFAAIQYFSADKELAIEEEQEFDPHKLPHLKGTEPISRLEKVIGLIFGVFFIVLMGRFYSQGGFSGDTGSVFFKNPVLDQYFPWLAIAMAGEIIMDVILLWKGRWQISTRLAYIGLRLYGLVLMYVLVQGHTAWLVQMGVTEGGVLHSLNYLGVNDQIAGMLLVRGFYRFVLLVTILDPLGQIFKLIMMKYAQPELKAEKLLNIPSV